jgi:CheY-like chemotaxis protein
MARVLVVDRDPEQLEEFLVSLRVHYEMRGATTSGQALEAVAGVEPPDAVICDLDSGGEASCSFLRQVQATRPDLAERFVFVADDPRSPSDPFWKAQRVLRRPVDRSQLLAALGEILPH